MGKTTIEWTGATWNPVRGCKMVSPGCANCYAMKQAGRFSGPGGAYEGLVKLRAKGKGFAWTGEFREVPDMLDLPLRTRKPTTWFVNSMSDLFGEDVSNEFIAAVFGVMASAPQHTYQILTKRAERMRAWFAWVSNGCGAERISRMIGVFGCGSALVRGRPIDGSWPLPNVWLGVSVESQDYHHRIDELLQTPAAVRFLSLEPLLGPINIGLLGTAPRDWGYGYRPVCDLLHWVIAGAESGHGARPMTEAWVRAIRDECVSAGVPFFYKQRLDERGRKVGLPELDGRVWNEMPGRSRNPHIAALQAPAEASAG